MRKPGTHKLTEAMEGQKPQGDRQGQQPGEAPQPGSTPQEVAEQTRREQEARSHGRERRDDHLVDLGRGQQTHG
jgi:hypothetical protein